MILSYKKQHVLTFLRVLLLSLTDFFFQISKYYVSKFSLAQRYQLVTGSSVFNSGRQGEVPD